MKLVLAIILGGSFGFVLYLSGASSPKKLTSMLRFEDLTLMKIILYALGLSSTLLAIASLLGWFNHQHLSVKSMNLGVIVGALLFGIGFGSVGTCPGTCVAATSSGGYKKALSSVLGGLLGAWVFSITYGFWKDLGLFSALDYGKLTLFNISEKYPALFSLGYWGLLIVGIIFIIIAIFIPSQSDTSHT